MPGQAQKTCLLLSGLGPGDRTGPRPLTAMGSRGVSLPSSLVASEGDRELSQEHSRRWGSRDWNLGCEARSPFPQRHPRALAPETQVQQTLELCDPFRARPLCPWILL